MEFVCVIKKIHLIPKKLYTSNNWFETDFNKLLNSKLFVVYCNIFRSVTLRGVNSITAATCTGIYDTGLFPNDKLCLYYRDNFCVVCGPRIVVTNFEYRNSYKFGKIEFVKLTFCSILVRIEKNYMISRFRVMLLSTVFHNLAPRAWCYLTLESNV